MGRKKTKREHELEKEYVTRIKYKCPKRGWVEEEVTVKRFKAVENKDEPNLYTINLDNEEESTEDE